MTLYYWNHKDWTLSPQPPGVPLPWPLALAVVPVMGLAFVVFVPTIGIVLFLGRAGRLAWKWMKRLAMLPFGRQIY